MCTSLIVKSRQGPVFARAMQWNLPEMHWTIVVSSKGHEEVFSLPGTSTVHQLVNRYSFVGIQTPKADNMIIDGQNEAGLTLSAQYLPYFTQYSQEPTHRNDLDAISIVDLGKKILGHFSCLSEVEEYLNGCTVWLPQKQFIVPLDVHFIIVDRSGKSLVTEFVDGKVKVYPDSLGVLCNAPNYDWLLTHLRNYLLLTSKFDETSQNCSFSNLPPLSAGSGTSGMPGSLMSPDRFIRGVFFKNSFPTLNTVDEAIPHLASMIETFNIPLGSILTHYEDQVFFETTQFILLKDLVNQCWFVRLTQDLQYTKIHLETLFQQRGCATYPLSEHYRLVTA